MQISPSVMKISQTKKGDWQKNSDLTMGCHLPEVDVTEMSRTV